MASVNAGEGASRVRGERTVKQPVRGPRRGSSTRGEEDGRGFVPRDVRGRTSSSDWDRGVFTEREEGEEDYRWVAAPKKFLSEPTASVTSSVSAAISDPQVGQGKGQRDRRERTSRRRGSGGSRGSGSGSREREASRGSRAGKGSGRANANSHIDGRDETSKSRVGMDTMDNKVGGNRGNGETGVTADDYVSEGSQSEAEEYDDGQGGQEIDRTSHTHNALTLEVDDMDLDPTVMKPGEFYSDYLVKAEASSKPNKSGRYVEDGSRIMGFGHTSLPPPTVKSSWTSVASTGEGSLRSAGKFSFVQVAHIRGARTEHVQCTVVRDRRASIQGKLHPTYELILEETNKTILLAQKMNLNRTSNYHLFDMTRATLATKMSKKSGNYLGRLRAKHSNRTEYVLLSQNSEREELAGVRFDRLSMLNQLKEGNQPRKMKVMVPLLCGDNVPVPNKTQEGDEGSLAEKLAAYEKTAIGSLKDLHVFETKDPVFENGNYRLNFHGRVSLPSVKNFQMVSRDNIDDIICQFGKVDEDVFHLDFKAPITAYQAFAFALCQFNL
ncbi:Tub family-domain-containing protein [Ochromonadaceae sp. CCMP2298]|nr:Tub family-domain-containing protein [Ochromonadaceae sp. CCMP2298]